MVLLLMSLRDPFASSGVLSRQVAVGAYYVADLFMAAVWVSALLPFCGLEAISLSRTLQRTVEQRRVGSVLGVITCIGMGGAAVLYALSVWVMSRNLKSLILNCKAAREIFLTAVEEGGSYVQLMEIGSDSNSSGTAGAAAAAVFRECRQDDMSRFVLWIAVALLGALVSALSSLSGLVNGLFSSTEYAMLILKDVSRAKELSLSNESQTDDMSVSQSASSNSHPHSHQSISRVRARRQVAGGVGEEGVAMTTIESPSYGSSDHAASAWLVAADAPFVAATPICLDAVEEGSEGGQGGGMRESGQMRESGVRCKSLSFRQSANSAAGRDSGWREIMSGLLGLRGVKGGSTTGRASWLARCFLGVCVLTTVASLTTLLALRHQKEEATGRDIAANIDTRLCNGFEHLCDRAYDKVTYGTIHNAMSALDDGFAVPNNFRSFNAGLDAGVRAVMLDIVSSAAFGARLCHQDCSLGQVRVRVRAWRCIRVCM